MSIDPSRDLERGQRVLIKTGTFGGMEGLVTHFRTGGELPTVVRIELRIHGRPVPVEFTNPTVDELERV
jgi:transcription antitermination factor NusG